MKKHEPTADEMRSFLLKNPRITQKQKEYIMRIGIEGLKKMLLAMFSRGDTKRPSGNTPSEDKFTEIFI